VLAIPNPDHDPASYPQIPRTRLNFESQGIDADDVEGGKGQVRAHQQDGAAMGMEYGDEADEDAGGAPQQVGGPEAESHILLAIDGAERFLELAGLF
jgi:hypothetical protein